MSCLKVHLKNRHKMKYDNHYEKNFKIGRGQLPTKDQIRNYFETVCVYGLLKGCIIHRRIHFRFT